MLGHANGDFVEFGGGAGRVRHGKQGISYKGSTKSGLR
jgi:hypothetical protein